MGSPCADVGVKDTPSSSLLFSTNLISWDRGNKRVGFLRPPAVNGPHHFLSFSLDSRQPQNQLSVFTKAGLITKDKEIEASPVSDSSVIWSQDFWLQDKCPRNSWAKRLLTAVMAPPEAMWQKGSVGAEWSNVACWMRMDTGDREANCSTPASESAAKLELQTRSHSSPMLQRVFNSIWKVGLCLLTGGGKALLNRWGRQEEAEEVITESQPGRQSHLRTSLSEYPKCYIAYNFYFCI